MKAAIFALFLAIAISCCYAAATGQPNLTTGVVDLITQLEKTLAPLLNALGPVGDLVTHILDAVKQLLAQLGNALAN